MPELKEVAESLFREENFVLVSHMSPDGDSVGSLLALAEGLEQLGKKVTLSIPGGVPQKFRFLKGSEKVAPEFVFDGRSAVVALDCSDLDRIRDFKAQVETAPILINIDHHISNRYFGTLNHVNSSASATGEIIFALLKALGADLTSSMAQSLYVALTTDTGSFRFDNTTPETHRITAALIEGGANPGLISRKVFDKRPLPFFMLLKGALSGLELYCRQKIAVMTISSDLLDRCRASEEDMDGIVNYARNIEGVELSILFYVNSAGGEVKVGFRSVRLDVSILAGRFGGGGHPKAAGCRVPGSYPEVKKAVLQEAEALLNPEHDRFVPVLTGGKP